VFEFQLGKLAEERLPHPFRELLRMDLFSKGQKVKKGPTSFDAPFSDQAAEGKESHSLRGIFLEHWRNKDLPFGVQFVETFHGRFGPHGCTAHE
jgi:hypothetical protein